MDDPTRTLRGDSVPSEGAPLTVWGPFELREKVGQGAFGEVYRAWDPKLQREVAVKLLLAGRAAGGYDFMLREARLTAKVRHPNVVSVHGVDLHEGRVGFWTDFVHGRTLAALLAAQGPFAAREAAMIGIELCGALSAVHAQGLLHCDIKPGNVMREAGGRILLMDFGMTRPNASNEFGGTLLYMAPEVLAGQPATVASDIYSLGALLFELVTGKFQVDAAGVRRNLLEERSGLPLQFARVVETAIDADPKKRFSSAGSFLAALSDAIGISSPPVLLVSAKRARFRWWIAALVSVVLLLAGYAIPGVRSRIDSGVQKATGAHADYFKAQDLLEHYYHPHSLEQSIPLFERVTQKEPKFAPAWAGLGRAYYRSYVDTRNAKYIPLVRSTCGKALELGQDLTSVHVTLGMLYTDTGQNDLATQELDEAQKLDATNAEVYAARADLDRKKGRNQEIQPALQKASDLDPKDWRWPNQLGIYYLYYSVPARLADAVGQFQKAAALTPDNARVYNNLGLAYMNLERFGDARAAYRKAIDFEADSTTYSNLAMVLQLEGDYANAATMFRRARDLNPSNYIAAGNYASALRWTPGKQDAAREAYRNAIALAERFLEDRPKDALVIARLGSYYATLGDVARGLPLLRQAAALDANDAEVLYNEGEGYELLHRREDALEFLGRAVQAGYSIEYIRRDPELAALRADPRFAAVERLSAAGHKK
jgi:serine/threonine protein kinase/Flp pilus assembly protein TadD